MDEIHGSMLCAFLSLQFELCHGKCEGLWGQRKDYWDVALSPPFVRIRVQHLTAWRRGGGGGGTGSLLWALWWQMLDRTTTSLSPFVLWWRDLKVNDIRTHVKRIYKTDSIFQSNYKLKLCSYHAIKMNMLCTDSQSHNAELEVQSRLKVTM